MMIEREHERIDERVALLLVLARVALEIIGVAFREDLLRLSAFRKSSASPSVRPGKRHARQGRRVQLLEARQRIGLHRLRHAGHRRQRHELAVAGAHLVARQPVGRQAEFARRLRDDLVAAAVEIEAVDVIAAEDRRQRRADVLHVDADAVGLVEVDLELILRRVELQIAVGEQEQAALARRLLHFGGDLGERLEVAGRADDELHRRAAGRAGQRGRREGQHLRAGDLQEFRPASRPALAWRCARADPRA